jgi:hypothetical protein
MSSGPLSIDVYVAFTTLAEKSGTVEDFVHRMLELHGERDQPHTLWISARAEVDRRT